MMTVGTGLGSGSRGPIGPSLFSIPAGFRWSPSFSILKSGNSYSTNFDISGYKPSGTIKYVTKSGNDTTGDGSSGNPYRTLTKADTAGANVVYVGQGVWDRSDGFAANFNPTRNMSIISLDGAGKAILTRHATGLSWTQQSSPNDNVYLATRSSVRTVIDLNAPRRSGEYLKDGVTKAPIPLSVQTSISNCQANPGSWYITGSNLYVRTFDGRAPDSNILVLLIENIMAPTNSVNLYLEGLEGWGDCLARHQPAANNTNTFAWKDCAARFGGSAANGLHINNIDYCYSLNCEITDLSSSVDAFNYHSDQAGLTTRTKFLEVGCRSRRIGLSGATNNNGSTSHDNCAGIRIGCDHQQSYGPTVGDVLGAHTLNFNVTGGNSLAVNGLSKCAFQIGTVSTIDGGNSKMWLYGSTAASGSYYARVQAAGGELYSDPTFTNGSSQGDNGTITTI